MPITEEFFNWLINLELEALWALLLWLPLIVRAKTFGYDLDYQQLCDNLVPAHTPRRVRRRVDPPPPPPPFGGTERR